MGVPYVWPIMKMLNQIIRLMAISVAKMSLGSMIVIAPGYSFHFYQFGASFLWYAG